MSSMPSAGGSRLGSLLLPARSRNAAHSATVSEIAPLLSGRLRGALLLWLCLLLTPEVALHSSLGLIVQWSHGLTLSNLVIPALAVLVLGLAWLRGQWSYGRRPFPSPWPRSLVLFAALLAWGAVTWLPWLFTGVLQGAGLISILAHWAKLLLIVAVAAHVAMLAARSSHGVLTVFLVCMAVNALIGLGQALKLFSVFSPLARLDQGVRVTGTFYDANMYGALLALALVVCVACAAGSELPLRLRLACVGAGGMLALNLVLAASRAGYLALAVALLVLTLLRCWKPLGWILLASAALCLCFPARTMGRLRTALDAGPAAVTPDAAARARAASMHDSFYQYLQHPWMGLGFGRALYLGVPGRAGFDYAGVIPLAPRQDRSFTGAQNMFLTVLAETGPVGLMLYLAWLTAVFRPFLRGAMARPSQRAGTHLDRTIACALLAGIAGMVAASCTVELFLNARMLGIVLVLAACRETAAHHHVPHHHRPA